MLEKKFRGVRLAVQISLVVLFLGIGAWLLLNRQYVVDQITVWNYHPTTEIAAIHDELDLTDSGTFNFYVTQPRVEDAADFNSLCPQREINNPILGCYSADRIYIYDVPNDDLDGIMQVTAAHEMLHAAWSRLGQDEKARLSGLLKKEYDQLDDADFKERMGYYERTEPGEFYNELHSIIGTEIKAITPELETYYKRYFQDRGVVVTLHAHYSKVFDKLEDKSNRLYEQLVSLDKQIAEQRKAYNHDLADLSADVASFNQRADDGSFSSNSEFQAERSALLVRSSQLEINRVALNEIIDRYNSLYEDYKDIAVQIQQLNKSIDSMSAAPAVPSVE